jgi:MOSC domain-containing protein YiiM
LREAAVIGTTQENKNEEIINIGKVVRTAYRKYQNQDSKPSGRNYTTKKDAQRKIEVTKEGIVGDYNHYRTVALKGTPNRAVSIWTTDVLDTLKSGQYPVEVGDLGENISIEGVNFTYFQVGKQYHFAGKHDGDNENEGVVIEITEKMDPCANLCKLPYINEPSLQPKERIQKCQNLLTTLDQKEGMRGWYAKVIRSGTIQAGDTVQLVAESNSDD